MMMNNQGGMMTQPAGSLPQGQQPPPPPAPQMIPTSVSAATTIQGRQAQNDEIIARCLLQTQRLRESLELLLNTTKQAALVEADESSNTVTSTPNSNPSLPTNVPSSSVLNANVRTIVDRKLLDMSTSLDQLVQLLDQFDFKFLQQQQPLINHFNELSLERQGQLLDEWSTNAKWANKLNEIAPLIQQNLQLYRRSNQRNLNATMRSRTTDGPSSMYIERIIAQFDSTQQQQTRDYALIIQRLSDHLTILQFDLYRSGLNIYLYIRSCAVEHVIIKPLNEKRIFGNNNSNNKLTTNHFSNYRALDIVAGHIRAAAVYFASVHAQADQALSKLLQYIYKYQTLHTHKCVQCQKHLLNGLQPTWHDFKTFEAYHEECLN